MVTFSRIPVLTIIVAFGLWSTIQFLPPALAQQPTAGKLQLQGHLRPEFSEAPVTGPLDGTATLHLAIGLPLRNGAALDTLLQALTDPNSPQYRKFLTPAEFEAQFDPTDQDYQAVITFARAKGFAVTTTVANRIVVEVSGPASAVESAFYVKLNNHRRTDGTIFYAPDREPSLDIDVPVLDIEGLDNFSPPQHGLVTKSMPRPARAIVPVAGSGPPPARLFDGSDFRNAYALGTSLTGKGQTVGIFELDGFFPKDISDYQSTFNCCNVVVLTVPAQNNFNYAGSSSCQIPSKNPPAPGCPHNDGEVALDIDMVIAMAPGLESAVVYEGTTANGVLGQMASPPAGIPLSFQLTASYTFGNNGTTQAIVSQMAGQGQTLFVIAGDGRAICPNEAGSGSRVLPYVTVVGGTILSMKGDGMSWVSETGAPAGGGVEVGAPIPSYQAGLATAANGGSSKWRNIPDVALTYNSILDIAQNGNTIGTGGTSAAAPLWAGFMALVNQQVQQYGTAPPGKGFGFLNPALYIIGNNPALYAAGFNDIVGGGSVKSTPPCTGYIGYTATTGYDLVTGWGSPTAGLIDLLAPKVKTPPPTNGPQCATLAAEIATTQKLIAQYIASLQSGSGNKTDLQNGLNDANKQLAGLEQQDATLGCVVLGGGSGPVKTP
jgi:subtilase family serine protease